MLMKLDTSWLLFAIVAVAMISYMFSLLLDALMRQDGFGPMGNAAIITIGFFGTIYAANIYGIRFRALADAAMAGGGGAFAAILLLSAMKAALNRLL